ncbi:MAG: Na+/H+ antiporter NhaC family protein [Deltaproteobacteria bacterium]|nr:Na+/H+ antiporter NhaC family protein [Deltaproteobacteria bacterium]
MGFKGLGEKLLRWRPDRALLLRASAVVLGLLVVVLLVDRGGAHGRVATSLAVTEKLLPDLKKAAGEPEEPLRLTLVVSGGEEGEREIARRTFSAAPWIREAAAGEVVDGELRAYLGFDEETASLSAAIELSRPGAGPPATAKTERRLISVWALTPPLLAILLAFATRRLFPSLISAIALAALLSAPDLTLLGVDYGLKEYLWAATASDAFKIWILVFTTALIGMVGVATRAGGVQGIVDRIATRARTRRATQGATMGMGLAIFFDDYANTIVVGTTMRGLTDKLRISREKLAYLVDSTSAPVAGVALISTWIGYEVGLFGDLGTSLGLGLDGYQLFFAALPYRFYCGFTLVFLILLIWLQRDYGPMLQAERRALHEGKVLRDGAEPLSGAGMERVAMEPGVRPLAHVALLPILVVILGAGVGLFLDGGGGAQLSADPARFFTYALWRDAFGGAENSTFVLAMAALAGSALVVALARLHRLLSPDAIVRSYARGVWSMAPAVVVLILAWGIKAACDDVGTSHFLIAWLQDSISVSALPLIIFILAAFVAFATGTSWGTMGILIPTAVPLAYHLGGEEALFVAAAAVLDGAIFGDHCSPISDTTVMSSIASGSDHLDHVRTQIPYALTSMVAAGLFGYVWWALGAPYPVGLGLGAMALFGVIRFVGRPVEEPA